MPSPRFHPTYRDLPGDLASTEAALASAVYERLCDRGRIEPGEPLLTVQDQYAHGLKYIQYRFPEKRP